MLQRLTIDIDQQKIVTDPSATTIVSAIAAKRGDSNILEIQFVRDGIGVEMDNSTTYKLGIKNKSALSAGYLVYSTTFTKSGVGTSALYTVAPTWETTDMAAAFTAKSEPTTLALGLEIQWSLSGVDKRTQIVTLNIENELNRSGSPSPVGVDQYYSEAEIDTMLAAILSGGNILIGTHARLVPTGTGFKVQTSPDGVTWSDGTSWP
jgi:hypothetical protein